MIRCNHPSKTTSNCVMGGKSLLYCRVCGAMGIPVEKRIKGGDAYTWVPPVALQQPRRRRWWRFKR